MSLAQGNNTPTRPRIEPGSPDPESDALTTRPVRPTYHACDITHVNIVGKQGGIVFYYYTTRYIMSNDIFLLCHEVASTTHVTELFTGQ